jgi:hypothetical protein
MNLAKLLRIAKRAAPTIIAALPVIAATVSAVKTAAKDEKAKPKP